MSVHKQAPRTVRERTTHREAREDTSGPALPLINGERYLRAGDAARVLSDAGVGVLSAGQVLRRHTRTGEVRTFEVHRRAWLYHRDDVLELAERYRGA